MAHKEENWTVTDFIRIPKPLSVNSLVSTKSNWMMWSMLALESMDTVVVSVAYFVVGDLFTFPGRA